VRDDSQENFVVDDGVEDSSTNSLIQLKEETVGRVFWFWTRKRALGPTGYLH
jgi:hypothetical protein